MLSWPDRTAPISARATIDLSKKRSWRDHSKAAASNASTWCGSIATDRLTRPSGLSLSRARAGLPCSTQASIAARHQADRFRRPLDTRRSRSTSAFSQLRSPGVTRRVVGWVATPLLYPGAPLTENPADSLMCCCIPLLRILGAHEPMYTTTQLLALLKRTDPDVTRDVLTYLVRKGLLAPAARGPGRGRPRLWTEAQVTYLAAVLRYRTAGYTWPGAAQQASSALQPQLPFSDGSP